MNIQDEKQHPIVHNCPLCGQVVYHTKNYDTEVCGWCVSLATDDRGQRITILPLHTTTKSFQVKSDSGMYETSQAVCFIGDIQCFVTKTPYGLVSVLVR